MDEYGSFHDASTNPDNETRVCYGCIRLGTGTVNPDGTFSSGTGPYIHTNSAHLTVGLRSATISSDGALRVVFDGTGPIGAILVNGDETTSERHIMVGATGGPQAFNVWFSKGTQKLLLNAQADYNEVKGQFPNLWVAAFYPQVRGVGQASKADRALTQVAALQGVVDEQAATLVDLLARVSALETGA